MSQFSPPSPAPYMPTRTPLTPEPDAMADFSRLNLRDARNSPPIRKSPCESPQPRICTPSRRSSAMEGGFPFDEPSPVRTGTPDSDFPRTNSPYRKQRPSLRSHHSLGSLTAPPMIRAHSSPTFTAAQFALANTQSTSAIRSASPLRSPRRARSPFRDDPYSVMSSSGASVISLDIESIAEDQELELTPRPFAPIDYNEISPYLATQPSNYAALNANSAPGLTRERSLRRRPASPLLNAATIRSGERTFESSPLLTATTKYTESFPSDLPHTVRSSASSSSLASSFSVPSTPTSIRSRSPSISGLETIPDSPDAEEEALEIERLERLERAMSASEKMDAGASPLVSLRVGGAADKNKRKRWSVCGGEKRSDLNLETIWED